MLYGGVENNPDHVQIINEKTSLDLMFRSSVGDGKYLLSDNKLEDIHRAYLGIIPLVEAHHPVANYQDFLESSKAKVRASNLLLLKRSFWEYSDYRDPVLNSSFGLAHYQFDSYAWNNRLAFEFQEYVEKYYPVAEHSHLTYFEYCNLLRYFYYSYAGYRTRPHAAVCVHAITGVHGWYACTCVHQTLSYGLRHSTDRDAVNHAVRAVCVRVSDVWCECGSTCLVPGG